MTTLTQADIPTGSWGSNIGPFTKPVWLQVREGSVCLNYDSAAPGTFDDGLMLYAHDNPGPGPVEMAVDGVVITTLTFRLSNPSGLPCRVWYAPFP
jgi:hypothetical protein